MNGRTFLLLLFVCASLQWEELKHCHSWALPTSCPTLHVLPVLQLTCDAVVSWITWLEKKKHLITANSQLIWKKVTCWWTAQNPNNTWNELIYQATSACVVLVSVVLFCAVAEMLHRTCTINILYNHQWRLRISNNAFWCFLSHIHLNKISQLLNTAPNLNQQKLQFHPTLTI